MSQYDDSPKHHLHPLISRQTSGLGGTAVPTWHTPHNAWRSGAAVGDLSLRQHGASHVKLENRHDTVYCRLPSICQACRRRPAVYQRRPRRPASTSRVDHDAHALASTCVYLASTWRRHCVDTGVEMPSTLRQNSVYSVCPGLSCLQGARKAKERKRER